MSDGPRSLASVDLNLLKALDALLQERSVTRAAQRLSITQPSMSSALGRLRALFGDDLLVRSGHAMRPTAVASALEPRVRRIVREIEDIVVSTGEFDPEAAEETFTILAEDYVALVLVQPLMAAVATEAPHVRIRLQRRPLEQHERLLERNEIDMAIVPSWLSAATDLPTETLFTDRFVAAAWRDNREVSEPLTFEQLERLPYLSYSIGPLESAVDTRLRELGHPLVPDTVVESFPLGVLLLAGTRQITFVQERLARGIAGAAGLRLLDPPFEAPALIETLVWHPRSSGAPAHRWLRERIRAIVDAL